MKITSQEEYGLRCVLQLAREQLGNTDANLEPGAIFVRDIAEREGLSVAYVEKILWTLSRSGIVESVRGPKGGYRLTRPNDRISLGEVMRALGGLQSGEEICSQFTGQSGHLRASTTTVRLASCLGQHHVTFVNSVFDKVPISTLLTGAIDVQFVQITGKNSLPAACYSSGSDKAIERSLAFFDLIPDFLVILEDKKMSAISRSIDQSRIQIRFRHRH